MEDIYEAETRKNPDYLKNLKVNWHEHIWPLLQRCSRLSWTKGQADSSHGTCHITNIQVFQSPGLDPSRCSTTNLNFVGPSAHGNLSEPKWQEILSDSSAASEPIRRGILSRMHLRVDANQTQTRADQAYPSSLSVSASLPGARSPAIRL